MITDELLKIYNEKSEIAPNSRNALSDMAFHFPVLRDFAADCSIIYELGVRELGASWAFLTGMADRNTCFVEASPRKLTITPGAIIHSIDHIHPDKFGGPGTLKHFQDIALENNVIHNFMEASSLDIKIISAHMIMFDTDHTYDQLSAELKLHGNKASKYLVFHDTVGCGQEIVPAINEFLEENKEWMVYYHTNECMGLTILAKLTEEQYQDMKNHQEKSAQGANHRPDYKESNND